MAEEKKKPTEKYTVGEIATETGMAVIDQETQKPITQTELLARMASDLERIKKNLVE